jgi:hypothetical protein
VQICQCPDSCQVLTLNAYLPQALAIRIVASLEPPAPAYNVSAIASSSRAAGAAAAAAAGAGQDVAVVLQQLHALASEVLGAAVEADQPLMEVGR